MEVEVFRKIIQAKTGVKLLALPRVFLSNMDAMDIRNVRMILKDKDHILLEFVREGDVNE